MDDDVSPSRSSSFSRRLFGKNAAAAVALLPTVAVAETNSISAAREHLGPRPEGLSAADWDEVYAKYSNLLRLYGQRLSAEEKHRLVAILTTNQRMLVSIRSFELQNSDPSACTLRLRL
jgi:hypothetical protein